MKSRTISGIEKFKNELSKTFLTLLEDIRGIKENLKKYENQVYTEQQVLDMLGIGAKTLRSYRINGLLAYSKIGNKFFYRQSDIDRMIDNARIECDNYEEAYG